ncbi:MULTISPECIES: hypothetical protein [unclassified Aminobacter]|nr:MULTISPECIES: hypothetical protein [unclassified Aminobacter]
MTKRRGGKGAGRRAALAEGAADVIVSDILPIVIVGLDPTIHA